MLEDEADVAPLRRQPGRVLALDLDVPVSGKSRPAMMRSSVDLPPPLGPSSAVSLPVGDVQVDVLQRHEVAERAVDACDA